MDAQQQVAALRNRLAAAEATADRFRVEAATAFRLLAEEEDARAADVKRLREASAAELEAGEAVHRRRLHASHARELDGAIAHGVELRELRRGHEEALEAAAAAAAADMQQLRDRHVVELQSAREEERARLRARIEPMLTSLQASGQQQEAELAETRLLVFEALGAPATTRRRLGL
jgi:hypothetical protein